MNHQTSINEKWGLFDFVMPNGRDADDTFDGLFVWNTINAERNSATFFR